MFIPVLDVRTNPSVPNRQIEKEDEIVLKHPKRHPSGQARVENEAAQIHPHTVSSLRATELACLRQDRLFRKSYLTIRHPRRKRHITSLSGEYEICNLLLNAILEAIEAKSRLNVSSAAHRLRKPDAAQSFMCLFRSQVCYLL